MKNINAPDHSHGTVKKIQAGSIWDYSPYYMTKNDVKIYLSDSGSDDDKKTYLDLTKKMFNSYFERIA